MTEDKIPAAISPAYVRCDREECDWQGYSWDSSLLMDALLDHIFTEHPPV